MGLHQTIIKSFYPAKETISNRKRQPTEWEAIFTNDRSDKGLIANIYKELIQLKDEKTDQLKNGQRT